MEEHLPSDLKSQQHCETSQHSRVKFNFEKSIITQDANKQLIEDKKIGDSFFKQGELRLLHGDSSGIQFFDLALQLDPQNPKLHYDQGLSLVEFGSERGKEKILLQAAKRFKSSVNLNPSFFEGWHAWGNVLFLLGKTTEEYHYFLEAEAKYKRAISLSKGQLSDVLSDLYWSYGSVWSVISKRSKEPSDMRFALQSFALAHQNQEDLPIEFWHDYGNIYLELAYRINDFRYFMQGIHCFKNAVSISISSFESWLQLALALSRLYSFTHHEDHFTQANECYTTAAQLNSKNLELWLNWAKLLHESGKLLKDPKRARCAIEKCHRAHSIDKTNALVIGVWAESLASLGSLTDQVNYIYEAQNKLSEVVNYASDPELLYASGYVLFTFGKYFQELDFYYQAAEKFQEGLSIDRTYHKLWHAIACSYTEAAKLEDDNSLFAKAHRFYQKALHLHGSSLYYFDYGYSLFKLGDFTEDSESLRLAIQNFEMALNIYKDAIYLHPDWLFYYGIAHDALGICTEDRSLYTKALELLNHVLMIDPEHPKVHHHLGLVYSHLAELSGETLPYQKSFYHYRLAQKKDEENDQIILDWAVTLAAYADTFDDVNESLAYFKEAEFKMTQAAKLGNTHAYYHLACLHALLSNPQKAIFFMYKADEMDSLPPIHELLEDDWLESLKSEPAFQDFLSHLEHKSSLQE